MYLYVRKFDLESLELVTVERILEGKRVFWKVVLEYSKTGVLDDRPHTIHVMGHGYRRQLQHALIDALDEIDEALKEFGECLALTREEYITLGLMAQFAHLEKAMSAFRSLSYPVETWEVKGPEEE